MKKVLSNSITSTSKQPFLKATFAHYQENAEEVIKSLCEAIVKDNTKATIIYGCVNSGTGTGIGDSAVISAGAVYYNGELYQVDAFSSASLVNGLIGVVTTTYATGDPVTFSDGTTHNVHQINKIFLTDAASVGTLDYDNWISTIPKRVSTIDDAWSSYSIVSGDFSGNGSPTFTSGSLKYNLIGKTLILTFNVAFTTGTNTNAVSVTLPNSWQNNSGVEINLGATIYEGTTRKACDAYITNGSGNLTFIPFGGGNFSNSTTCTVQGQIIIQL